MEHKNDLDELLISYLLNESNAKEEAFILKWIDTDEANRLHFEELKKAVRLVDLKQAHENINLNNEWTHFKALLATRELAGEASDENDIPANNSDDYGYPQQRSAFRRMFVSVAVAASILLVIGLSWKMFTDQRAVEVFEIVKAEKTTGNLQSSLRYEVNTSKKSKTVLLPDGTEVILEEKSELFFNDPFPIDKRDVTVKGKARFKVAKDKSKPFTVFSGDISTTALGTDFTVTAYEYADDIVIRLYEGKVVIRSTDKVKRKLKKSYYLLAGQELIYDNMRSVAKVRMFKVNSAAKVRIENRDTQNMVIDNPSIPLHNLGSWYMFNNQSLSQVFEQLESLYDVDLVYDKKDVRKLYFIGKFNKSDSLEEILKQITTLNNLVIIKKNNKYLISKKTDK